MNAANLLTMSRIVMVPLVAVALWWPDPAGGRWACAFFVLAAATDWLDGYVARRFKLASAFGAFLDPVADKIMVAAVLVLLLERDPSRWLAICALIIITREIAVASLREYMASVGARAAVAVSMTGKIKTTAQMTALALLLYRDPVLGIETMQIGAGLLWLAAVLTVWSMVEYALAARRALQPGV